MELGNVALQAGNKIYPYNPELDYPDPFLPRYLDMYNSTSNLAANKGFGLLFTIPQSPSPDTWQPIRPVE
jgi:hypothetical protein